MLKDLLKEYQRVSGEVEKLEEELNHSYDTRKSPSFFGSGRASKPSDPTARSFFSREEKRRQIEKRAEVLKVLEKRIRDSVTDESVYMDIELTYLLGIKKQFRNGEKKRMLQYIETH